MKATEMLAVAFLLVLLCFYSALASDSAALGERPALVVGLFDGGSGKGRDIFRALADAPTLLEEAAQGLEVYEASFSSPLLVAKAFAQEEQGAVDVALVALERGEHDDPLALQGRLAQATASLLRESGAGEGQRKALLVFCEEGAREGVEGEIGRAWAAASLSAPYLSPPLSLSASLFNRTESRLVFLDGEGAPPPSAAPLFRSLVGSYANLTSARNVITSLSPPSSPSHASASAEREGAKREEREMAALLREAVRGALAAALGERGEGEGGAGGLSLSSLPKLQAPGDFRRGLEELEGRGVAHLEGVLQGGERGKGKEKGGQSKGALLLLHSARQQFYLQFYSALSSLLEERAGRYVGEGGQLFNHLLKEVDYTGGGLPGGLLRELRGVKERALRETEGKLRAFLPPHCPPVCFSPISSLADFGERLEDSLRANVARFRLLGFLPRGGRPPVDLSLHLLLPPPGPLRDHRQDVLGGEGRGDTLLFDPSLSPYLEREAEPLKIRRALQQQLQEREEQAKKTGARGFWGFSLSRYLEERELKRQSEFAREMLMFPLSLKRGPLGKGKRRGREGGGQAPRRDEQRREEGPERFVRWDLSPLDEVRANLERLRGEREQGEKSKGGALPLSLLPKWEELSLLFEKAVDEVADCLPASRNNHYHHPSVNYGPLYSVRGGKQ